MRSCQIDNAHLDFRFEVILYLQPITHGVATPLRCLVIIEEDLGEVNNLEQQSVVEFFQLQLFSDCTVKVDQTCQELMFFVGNICLVGAAF